MNLRSDLIEILTEYVRDPGGWPDAELAAAAFDDMVDAFSDERMEVCYQHDLDYDSVDPPPRRSEVFRCLIAKCALTPSSMVSWPQWLLNKKGTHCSTQYTDSGEVFLEGCHRTWTASKEAHCLGTRKDGTVCHQHFSADSVADKHRDRGSCQTPEEMADNRTKTGKPRMRSTLTPDGDVLWRHGEALTVKPAYMVSK